MTVDMADAVDRALAISTLAVASATSLFTGYIAFVTLQFAARPKVAIRLLNPRDDNQELGFPARSRQVLRFMISNIGRGYAHPAARRIHMFISFSVGCLPRELRYGSCQEIISRDVKQGVGARLYVEASGISVFHGEPGEEFHVDVTMPPETGRHSCYIAASCGDGIDLGFHELPFDVWT